jgi:hypothetical protein
MYPSSSNGLNKETDEAVYFFTPVFYPLDNFSAHQVEIWGHKFPTAEHAFQWKKFSGGYPEISEQILAAGSPEAVKKISDANKALQPITWKDEKVGVMEEILMAKAEQNEDVREALKRSARRRIIENSPVDGFWGIGPNGDGQNMVGKIWMKVRDNLLNN